MTAFDESRQELIFNLEHLLQVLPKVIVMGIPTVERAVINKEKDGKYNLLVEGTNMQVCGGEDKYIFRHLFFLLVWTQFSQDSLPADTLVKDMESSE